MRHRLKIVEIQDWDKWQHLRHPTRAWIWQCNVMGKSRSLFCAGLADMRGSGMAMMNKLWCTGSMLSPQSQRLICYVLLHHQALSETIRYWWFGRRIGRSRIMWLSLNYEPAISPEWSPSDQRCNICQIKSVHQDIHDKSDSSLLLWELR